MVHLPQKEVSTRMSKEELEECAMSCIENNFKFIDFVPVMWYNINRC